MTLTFANMTLVIRNMIHQNGGDIRGAISSSAGQFDIQTKNNDLDINGFGISDMCLSVTIEFMMKYRYICFSTGAVVKPWNHRHMITLVDSTIGSSAEQCWTSGG